MVLLKCRKGIAINRANFNLHSTMVLLKFSVIDTLKLGTSKSTFHYGSIKIFNQHFISISRRKSTFHYGSIKIKRFKILKIYLIKSTFHYGSIKIFNI